MSIHDQHEQTGQRTDVSGQETQEVPEDEGVLQPSETLESDDFSADPLDTGISPPERHPASERFGVTEAEAREGETLDQRIAQEQPDQPAGDPGAVDGTATASDVESGSRAGRLVAADEVGLRVNEAEPRQFAHEVGRDGGAASAEEAAVHLIPESETGPEPDSADEPAPPDEESS